MKTYNKPALTYEEQIELLKNRGLVIIDAARAKRHLSYVSYYRLSAYMLPYKLSQSKGDISDYFKESISWDDVWNLYKFDRKLRLLVFDAIERIEIALRAQIIYQLSHKYGSHWQNDSSLFKTTSNPKTGKIFSVYNDIQAHITEQLNANRKVQFVEHYLKKYNCPKTPPCWMSIELLYFSELSKICQGLNRRSDRTALAKAFGLIDDSTFCSWLHTLNYIRNICAHHARLWNVQIDVIPKKYYNKTNYIWMTDDEVDCVQSSKLYYTLCIIMYLLQTVNPGTKFKQHFYELLEEYPIVNTGYMGFPEGWEKMSLWKNS